MFDLTLGINPLLIGPVFRFSFSFGFPSSSSINSPKQDFLWELFNGAPFPLALDLCASMFMSMLEARNIPLFIAFLRFVLVYGSWVYVTRMFV